MNVTHTHTQVRLSLLTSLAQLPQLFKRHTSKVPGFILSYSCGITLHYGVRHQSRSLLNCTVRTSSVCWNSSQPPLCQAHSIHFHTLYLMLYDKIQSLNSSLHFVNNLGPFLIEVMEQVNIKRFFHSKHTSSYKDSCIINNYTTKWHHHRYTFAIFLQSL